MLVNLELSSLCLPAHSALSTCLSLLTVVACLVRAQAWGLWSCALAITSCFPCCSALTLLATLGNPVRRRGAAIKLLREIYFCQFGGPQKAQFKTRLDATMGEAGQAASSSPALAPSCFLCVPLRLPASTFARRRPGLLVIY